VPAGSELNEGLGHDGNDFGIWGILYFLFEFKWN